MISHKFSLDKSFEEILNGIDNWINEGFGWIIEFIASEYINVSSYRLLSGSSCIKLPAELKSPTRELINIKITIKSVFYVVMLSILIP